MAHTRAINPRLLCGAPVLVPGTVSAKRLWNAQIIQTPPPQRKGENCPGPIWGLYAAHWWLKIDRTAIHIDGLAGNRAGVVGAEKKCRAGNFVCGLTTALKNGFEESCKLILFAHL
jgi:hypothetical protein